MTKSQSNNIGEKIVDSELYKAINSGEVKAYTVIAFTGHESLLRPKNEHWILGERKDASTHEIKVGDTLYLKNKRVIENRGKTLNILGFYGEEAEEVVSEYFNPETENANQ